MVKIKKPTQKKKVTFKTTPGASDSQRESVRIKNVGVRAFNFAVSRGSSASAQRKAQEDAIRKAEIARQKQIQLDQIRARQKAIQEAAQEKQRIFELGIKLRRQQAQRRTQILTDRRTKDRLRVTTVIDNRTKERIVTTKNLTTGLVTTRTFEKTKGRRGTRETGGIITTPGKVTKKQFSAIIAGQVQVPSGSGKVTRAIDVGGGQMQDFVISFSGGRITGSKALGKPIPQTQRFIEKGIKISIFGDSTKDLINKQIATETNPKKLASLKKLRDKLNRNIKTLRAIPFKKRGGKGQAKLLGSQGAKVLVDTAEAFEAIGKGLLKVITDKKVTDKLLASIEKNLNPKKLISKLQTPGALPSAGRKIKGVAVSGVRIVDTGVKFAKKHPDEAVVVIGTEVALAIVGGKALGVTGKVIKKGARVTRLDKLVTKGKGKLFLQEGGKLESVRIKGTVETKLKPKQIKTLKSITLADRSKKVDQFTNAAISVLERRTNRKLDATARLFLQRTIRREIIKRLKARGIDVIKTQAVVSLKQVPLRKRLLARLNRRIDIIEKGFAKIGKKRKGKKKAREALRQRTVILTTIERKSLIPAIEAYSKRVARQLEIKGGKIIGQSQLERNAAKIKKRVIAEFKKRNIPIQIVKQITVPKSKITARALTQAKKFFKLPKFLKKDISKVRLKKIKGRRKKAKRELKAFRKRRLKQFAVLETRSIEPQIKNLSNKLSSEFERRLNMKRIRPLSFNESLNLRELIEKKIRNTLKAKKIPTSITREIKVPRAKLTRRAFNKLKTFFKLPKVSKKDVRKIRIKRRAKLTKKELKAFRKGRVKNFKVIKNGKRFFDDDIKRFSDKLSRFVETKGNKILSFSDKLDLRKELNKLVKNKLANKKVKFDGLKSILKRGKVRIEINNIEIKRIVNLKKIKPTKTKPLEVKDGKIQLKLPEKVKPKDGKILVTVGGRTQLILLKKPKIKLKLKTKQIQIQKKKFKQIQIQRQQKQLKFKFKQKKKLRKSLRLVPLFKQGAKVTQANIQKSASDTANIIDTITATITQKGSTLALRNQLKNAQQTRQILLKLKLTATKKKELLAKFKKKKKRKVKPKAFKKGQGFNVLARPTKKRKGQKRSGLIRVNKKPLNQKDAKDLRNFILDTSLSRSGRIKPTKGKPKKAEIKIPSSFSTKTSGKFRNFRIVKGKRIPLVRGGVIEKKTKLLDTKQERANITLRRRIKQLTKKPTKKKPKRTPKKPTVNQGAIRRQRLANLKKARRVKANLAKGRRRSSTAATSLTTRRRIISII